MHRCFKFDSLVNKRMEWHVFSDASVIGYGIVFYIRITYNDDVYLLLW